MKVIPCPMPADALLQRYVGQGAGYTDCYCAQVAGAVPLARFVGAFYTTALFRAERLVLTLALRRRISDDDIAAMLEGRSDSFAAWRIEARDAGQLLLCDVSGVTRSWFAAREGSGQTKLYFGSAIVMTGARLHWLARASVPLHRIYSKALLRTAVKAV